MNRLLELHGDEKEFSQNRLLDKDEDLQKELKSIRVSLHDVAFLAKIFLVCLLTQIDFGV